MILLLLRLFRAGADPELVVERLPFSLEFPDLDRAADDGR